MMRCWPSSQQRASEEWRLEWGFYKYVGRGRGDRLAYKSSGLGILYDGETFKNAQQGRSDSIFDLLVVTGQASVMGLITVQALGLQRYN
jgi:hypothetical protein